MVVIFVQILTLFLLKAIETKPFDFSLGLKDIINLKIVSYKWKNNVVYTYMIGKCWMNGRHFLKFF